MDTANNIYTQLRELHFPGMRKCWQTLMETRQCDTMPLADGLQLMLQAERDHRRNSRQSSGGRNGWKSGYLFINSKSIFISHIITFFLNKRK